MNDLTFPFDACGQEGEEEEGRDRGSGSRSRARRASLGWRSEAGRCAVEFSNSPLYKNDVEHMDSHTSISTHSPLKKIRAPFRSCWRLSRVCAARHKAQVRLLVHFMKTSPANLRPNGALHLSVSTHPVDTRRGLGYSCRYLRWIREKLSRFSRDRLSLKRLAASSQLT